jgi:hypothetical protein
MLNVLVQIANKNGIQKKDVVSRYGNLIRPARSPDLPTCHSFLWGYQKSQVFKVPAPHTVQELKHRIQEAVEQIPIDMLQRVPSA